MSNLETSIEFIYFSPLNIPIIFFTFPVLKLSKFILLNFSQFWNIFDISVTLEVSKLDKSIEDKDLQLSNNEDISVTFEVVKYLVFRVLIFEQSRNILFILVTCSVLNLERSKEDNPEQ